MTTPIELTNDLVSVLKHLKALVSFDTQNPPRDISTASEIFAYLKNNLPGFDFTLVDSGDGCLSLLAKRGKPSLLFNFHIDTVPVANGWLSDPFELVIDDEKNRAVALGACDIKGASACMLSAVAQSQGDVALLFSSDEEHGSSVAVKAFLKTEHGFNRVIVSEPTNAEAVLAHRGIQNATFNFSGISGHASEARALKDSAIHKSGRWISASLEWVEKQDHKFDNLSGLPFNVGKIDGGLKANMIAASCDLSIGFRPLPGQNAKAMLQELHQLSADVNDLSLNETIMTDGFYGPTLPAANVSFNQAIENATALATDHSIAVGPAVSFWTEASLFSEAGLTAIVFGPGNIAQAHTANEWVYLAQLKKVEKHYIQILDQYIQDSESLISGKHHE